MTAKAADRLCPGERCLAAGKGLSARPKPGTIESVLEKRYFVVLDGETESQPFSFKKVKRLGKPAKKIPAVSNFQQRIDEEGIESVLEAHRAVFGSTAPDAKLRDQFPPVVDMREFAAECNRDVARAADPYLEGILDRGDARRAARDQRPPTRLHIPDANVPTYPVNGSTEIRYGQPDIEKVAAFNERVAEHLADGLQARHHERLAHLSPQPKPKKPSRSEAYLQHVREHDCCNCGAPGPSDPDHNGKHGMSQKATDYGAIPLCRFPCHRFRTDRNTLPDPALIGLDIPDREKGRAKSETELIVLRAQVQMLCEWVEKQEKETT